MRGGTADDVEVGWCGQRYGGLKMEEKTVAVIDVFTYKGYIDVYHADARVHNRTRGR